jgi:Helitron helicase-like domain at N-terminus
MEHLPPESASFAQIYMLDPDEAAARRLEVVGHDDDVIRVEVLNILHRKLVAHNPWVQQLRAAAAQNIPVIEWQSDIDVTGMTLGAIVVAPGSRSIVIRRTSTDRPEFISDGHSLYHTLSYPLLFPTGTPGWHDGMSCWDPLQGSQRRVTLWEWARHALMHRQSPSFVQRCERLALEYYCDMFAQYEARVAAFHQLPRQQSLYRGASYRAVQDQFQRDGAEARLADVGRPVVLPSTFVGSPRYYYQLYLDAMALPLRYHKPDLFITMTCNPFWPEISRAIPAGSHWRFHPDIVGRVFMLKFAAVLHDITVSHIFGPVLAYVWRVEWQVRSSMR